MLQVYDGNTNQTTYYVGKLKLQTFEDEGGSWRWNATAKNGKVVSTSGESFASKRNAERALKTYIDSFFDGEK